MTHICLQGCEAVRTGLDYEVPGGGGLEYLLLNVTLPPPVHMLGWLPCAPIHCQLLGSLPKIMGLSKALGCLLLHQHYSHGGDHGTVLLLLHPPGLLGGGGQPPHSQAGPLLPHLHDLHVHLLPVKEGDPGVHHDRCVGRDVLSALHICVKVAPSLPRLQGPPYQFHSSLRQSSQPWSSPRTPTRGCMPGWVGGLTTSCSLVIVLSSSS